MSDVERFVAATADATGCALVKGAHGVQHRGAVLRAHPEADFHRGVERYWSTGRQISHEYVLRCGTHLALLGSPLNCFLNLKN